MTLTQLTYIVAIDTYRSFGKAAEKCLVTQPTLSMQVKKLEKELDVVLFDRSKQPIIPTQLGSRIVHQARLILRESAKMQQIINDDRSHLAGSLAIGVIPTIAPFLLPYFLGEFSAKYPEIELTIEEMKTENIMTALHKDLLDAAILATPLHDPGVYETPLYYEEILLYVNPTHPLAARRTVSPQDLMPEDMWMLNQGNCFRGHIINLCEMRKETPLSNFRYQSGSLETLKKLVNVEGGYTLLPELAVMELPVKTLKRIRHFKDITPLREVSLVTVRKNIKRKLVDCLKELILMNVPAEVRKKERGQMVEWK